MANRRQIVRDYYVNKTGKTALQKSAASGSRYDFINSGVAITAVIRTDLNNYSAWASANSLAARVQLLDSMFSTLVPAIEDRGGVYFRDEGDCIVSLFSSRFGGVDFFDSADSFSRIAAGNTYGRDALSAKVCISIGEVAYFQKAHEVGTDDWSAEGVPFVRAARLEAAVDSKPQINYFANEFDRHISPSISWAPSGYTAPWYIKNEKIQVQGLGLVGGWADTTAIIKS